MPRFEAPWRSPSAPKCRTTRRWPARTQARVFDLATQTDPLGLAGELPSRERLGIGRAHSAFSRCRSIPASAGLDRSAPHAQVGPRQRSPCSWVRGGTRRAYCSMNLLIDRNRTPGLWCRRTYQNSNIWSNYRSATPKSAGRPERRCCDWTLPRCAWSRSGIGEFPPLRRPNSACRHCSVSSDIRHRDRTRSPTADDRPVAVAQCQCP